MGWLVRCHHILTRIPAMATPQTFQNPETKTSPYVTETRQTSRDRYVLPFTSTSKPPMSTSNQQQPPAATTSSNHQQQPPPAPAATTSNQQQPPATSSNQQQPAAPATSSTSNQQQRDATRRRCATSRSVYKVPPRRFMCDTLYET